MNKSPSATSHAISAFEVGLLVFTIVVLVGLIADTFMVLPHEVSNLIHMVDTFGCAIFFLDFCYRFYRADSKLAFMKWGWIDLIASVPNLQILRWGRLVRVLRVIRLLRGIRSVQLVLSAALQDRLQGGVSSVVFGVVLLVSFSSASVLICERQSDANIKTAEDALWWSMATVTTVGYGDKYPLTTEGRVIGVILMVAGVSMFGCLSGLAASFFLQPKERKPSELGEIMVRLEQIQKQLEFLGVRCEAAGEKGLQPQSR